MHNLTFVNVAEVLGNLLAEWLVFLVLVKPKVRSSIPDVPDSAKYTRKLVSCVYARVKLVAVSI